MEIPSFTSRGWLAYMGLLLAFNLLIWSGPFLAMAHSPLAAPVYEGLHFTCHQLDSRSLCVYPSGNGGKFIDDCTVQDGKLYYERNMMVYGPEKYHQAPEAGGAAMPAAVGYKIPVCSRDIAIYGSMFLAGFAWLWWARRKPGRASDWPHPIWLVLALVPMALDGFTQLFGWRESTNELRLLSGIIAGAAMAFYALPGMYMLFEGRLVGKKKGAA
ncbi:Uncharacterised protein [uncultured archaeon]|nr:Uncharacterised protein [uncultured archaeon]